jgi:hypothetical protein
MKAREEKGHRDGWIHIRTAINTNSETKQTIQNIASWALQGEMILNCLSISTESRWKTAALQPNSWNIQ